MKNMKRLVAFLLINCLILSSIGTVSVKAEETQKLFEGDGYRIVVSAMEQWADGYLGNVVITNTGTKAIKNWKIISPKDMGELDNVWNVDLLEEKDDYIWGCQIHNRTISAGDSVSFGYQASGKSISALNSMTLETAKRQLQNKGYEISYQIKSNWANHAIIETTIHNISEEMLKDWELELLWDVDIDSIWNASLKSHKDGKYIIENEGYNADIAPASNITFEIQVTYPNGEVTCPANALLFCESKADNKEDTTEKGTETATEGQEEATTEENQDDLDEIEYTDWNQKMIHSDSEAVEKIKESNPGLVKVCILDSGIDYIPGMNVVQYKDFLDGYDEDIMYNDLNGHGTAVAGILAADAKEIVSLEQEEEEDFSEDEVTEEEEDFDESQFQDAAEITVTPQTDAELKAIMEQDGDAVEEEDIEEEGEEDDDEFLDWDDPEDIEEWLGEGQKQFNGVNPNVEIYSGRILDEENETTVERAVAGIEWAVENKVDILSISWGLDTSSEQLYRAIKKAYQAGILIIAAAGNDEKIQYPACYKEVMAVGSVDSEGIAGEESPKGRELEIVAPGVDICSYSSFGMLDMFSGTSFAVPQVVGLAALIWQKNLTKSSEFVRQLIDVSANSLGDSDSFGYGLIDYENALQQYDSFDEVYVEQESLTENVDDNIEAGIIEENNAEIPTIDTAVIEGLWSGTEHENMTKGAKKILKIGAKISDSNEGFKGMKKNPGFHGYFGKNDKTKTNYIKAYLYLTEQAVSYLETGKYTDEYQTKGKGIEDMHKTFSVNIEDALSKKYSINGEKDIKINTNRKKFYFVYGMALHTLADIFAHSAYAYSSYEIVKGDGKGAEGKEKHYVFKNTIAWTYISHGFNLKKDGFAFNRADNKAVYNARYLSAQKICQKVVKRIKKGLDEKKSGEQLVGKVTDFNAISKQNIKRMKTLAKKSKKSKVHDGDELYKLCKKVFLLKGFYANMNAITKKNEDKYEKLMDKVKCMDLKKVKKKLKNKILINVVLKDSNRITFKDKKARVEVHYKEGGKTKTVKLKQGKFNFSLDDKDKNKKKIKYWITIKAPAQNNSSANKSKAMRQYSLQQSDTQEREYTTTKLLNITDAPEEKLESENWMVACRGGEIELSDEDFVEEKQAQAMLAGLVAKDNASPDSGSGKTDAEPLSGVTVALKQGSRVVDTCISDSKGVYQFTKVAKGSYVMHYECAGYIPLDYYISVGEEDTVLAPKLVAMIKEMQCGNTCYEGGVVSQLKSLVPRDVDGLNIEVRKGIYNKTGAVVEMAKTESDGSYELHGLPMGYYTLHIFREGESKYKIYDEYAVIAVNKERVKYVDNDLVFAQGALTTEKLRVKLAWDENKTFKSILAYKDSNQQLHKLSYANQERSKEIQINYGIKASNMSTYIPPETVDIYNAGEYGYDYYVYGEGMMPEQLQWEDVAVQLYEPEKVSASYTFHPPVGSGKYWKVFHYDGKTGHITPINQMVDEIE